MKIKLSAVAILLLSAGALFVPNEFLGGSTPLLESAKDGLHVPGFAIVTMCLTLLLRKKDGQIRVLFPAVVAVFLAASSELIQPLFGRGAQWHDLAANGLGIIFGSVWLACFRHFRGNNARKILVLVLILMSGIFLLPFLRYQKDRDWLEQRMPTLAQFDDRRILEFFRPSAHCNIAILPANQGQPSILDVSQRDPESLAFLSFWLAGTSQDWSRFQTLRISLENPGAPFRLNLSIGETGRRVMKERHVQSLNLEPGINTFSIEIADLKSKAEERSLEARQIEQLVFGMAPALEKRSFQIRRIWLE